MKTLLFLFALLLPACESTSSKIRTVENQKWMLKAMAQGCRYIVARNLEDVGGEIR